MAAFLTWSEIGYGHPDVCFMPKKPTWNLEGRNVSSRRIRRADPLPERLIILSFAIDEARQGTPLGPIQVVGSSLSFDPNVGDYGGKVLSLLRDD